MELRMIEDVGPRLRACDKCFEWHRNEIQRMLDVKRPISIDPRLIFQRREQMAVITGLGKRPELRDQAIDPQILEFGCYFFLSPVPQCANGNGEFLLWNVPRKSNHFSIGTGR